MLWLHWNYTRWCPWRHWWQRSTHISHRLCIDFAESMVLSTSRKREYEIVTTLSWDWCRRLNLQVVTYASFHKEDTLRTRSVTWIDTTLGCHKPHVTRGDQRDMLTHFKNIVEWLSTSVIGYTLARCQFIFGIQRKSTTDHHFTTRSTRQPRLSAVVNDFRMPSNDCTKWDVWQQRLRRHDMHRVPTFPFTYPGVKYDWQ